MDNSFGLDIIESEHWPELKSARELAEQCNLTETRFRHKWTGISRHYRIEELTPPVRLFGCGFVGLKPTDRVIGMGGTRSPTVEAFLAAHRISREIARKGCVVCSGGVPGIDAAAHLGAMDAPDGTTIAILANPAHQGLGGHEWDSRLLNDAILERGQFISEYEDFVELASQEFNERLLQRDRIISGLSQTFVVFECRENGATIDTALRASIQGKTVVAIQTSASKLRKGEFQIEEEQIGRVFRYSDDQVPSIVDQILELTPQPADTRC